MTVYSKLPEFEREYFVDQLKEKINIKVSGKNKNFKSNKEENED